jgi:hypothetical protein
MQAGAEKSRPSEIQTGDAHAISTTVILLTALKRARLRTCTLEFQRSMPRCSAAVSQISAGAIVREYFLLV